MSGEDGGGLSQTIKSRNKFGMTGWMKVVELNKSSFYAILLKNRGCPEMEIYELVIEIKLLERRLTLYEEKYGVLSDDFYSEIMSGKLAEYDSYDETRADFSRWKGIYETLQRRKASYRKQREGLELAKVIRFQPVY